MSDATRCQFYVVGADGSLHFDRSRSRSRLRCAGIRHAQLSLSVFLDQGHTAEELTAQFESVSLRPYGKQSMQEADHNERIYHFGSRKGERVKT